MHILLLYNEPVLPADHPDYASEAGVLESVEAFATALGKAGHAVERVGIGRLLAQLVDRLSSARADVVVNFCEGFAGRSRGEAYVTGLLELLEMPYTGSPPECLALVHDKVRTKQVLTAAGVPTARYWHVQRDENLAGASFAAELRQRLGAEKLFVKPAAEDASLGIDDNSVATDWDGLARKTRDVQTRYGDVLIERFLDGREFNVGVIALPLPRVLPIAEIEFEASPELPWPVVTYQSKWSTSSDAFRATPVRCPAEVAPSLRTQIEQAALAAFRATGCRDYARVDLRATGDGEVFVLEVNGNPDAGPSAGLARALSVAGIAYDEFVVQLVTTAANRTRRAKATADLSSKSSQPEDAAPTAVRIRPLKESDKTVLLELLAACEMFRPDEIDVADEILREALRDGAASHYQVLVAEYSGVGVGWSCHGRVPMSHATYDLYWIAVHPDHQRRRIGRKLLDEIAGSLRRAGARWLLAETSSTPLYEKTRAFYERAGFSIVGDVPDFYRKGDGRVTYGKRIE